MAIIITWSKTALQDLQKLMDYLQKNWGDAAAKEFSTTLENKLAILKRMPESGEQVWFRKNVRKCVLTKHNTLYYKLPFPFCNTISSTTPATLAVMVLFIFINI